MSAESENETIELKGRGVWEHYTVQDGLPDMKIECVYEDRGGMIWVGTHDGGVACYDGYGFKTYNRRDGLAGSGVFSVIEDGEGHLWFGTNMGLSRFDGETFENFYPDEPRCFLWGSCVDKEGNLWFGLEGKVGSPPAVCVWDGESLETFYVDEKQAGHDEVGYSINCVEVDKEGKVWLGGYGLYCYQGGEFRCVVGFAGMFQQIGSIVFGVNDRLFIACVSGIYHLHNGELVLFDDVNRQRPLRMINSNSNVFYIITLGYLFLIGHDGDLIEVIEITNKEIYNSYIDKIGNLWLCGYGTGLFCYSQHKFKIYEKKDDSRYRGVACIASNSLGHLYIGIGKSVFQIDKRLNFMNRINLGVQYKFDFNVSVICADNEGRVWVGGSGSVECISNEGCVLNSIRFTDENDVNLTSMKLCAASEYIVLGAKNGRGIGFVSGGGTYRFPECSRDSYPQFVGAIEVDSEGYIWIGSSSPISWDGLCRYRDGRSEHVDWLSGYSILALHISYDNKLWIGTNEGLVSYDLDGHNKKLYTKSNGLSCEVITVIGESNDGIIWLGTEGHGVFCFDGSVFQNIMISDSPDHNVIIGIVEGGDGRMWFATKGGLVQYSRDKTRPTIDISYIGIDQDIVHRDVIKAPKSAKRIRVCMKGFSPVDNANNIIYRYRLQGTGVGWRQTDENFVEFMGLEPGDYIFTVQAVDQDLNYSRTKKARISIEEESWISALSITHRPAYRGECKGTVLIMDQDRVFSSHCCDFLRRLGFKVFSADNVVTGKDMVIDNEVHVWLIDSTTLSGNLYDVLHLSRFYDIEIVVLKEYEDLIDDKNEITVTLRSIVKPFQGDQLLDLLQLAIAVRRDPMLEHIRINIKNIRSRDEVAQQFKVTTNTVSNRIARLTQRSFTDYLQTCRIQEAQSLLMNSDLNVKQIGIRVGYESSEGFIRSFKRVLGQSPLQYRKSLLSRVI